MYFDIMLVFQQMKIVKHHFLLKYSSYVKGTQDTICMYLISLRGKKGRFGK